jgi:hypothetical protein
MTSQKQIIANRRNALKSTGPCTEEGKAIVCQNAIKHGILCQEVPLDEADGASFNEFSSRLFVQLNPVGDFEQFIVDRIVSSAWRLRRIIHIETAVYRSKLNPTYGVFDDPSIKDAFSGSAKEGMAVLSRYEIAIEKSLYKALAELMRLQALRQGVHFNPEMSGIGFVSQNDESDGNSASDSL